MKKEELCPVCSSTELDVLEDERRIRARDGSEVPYHAQYTVCERCGEEFFTRAQSRAASRAAAAALRVHAGLLTPAEIVAIRAKYQVTQAQFETVLKLGRKTVVRWETGTVTQSKAADQLLREVRASPLMFRRLAEEAEVSLPESRATADPWSHVEKVMDGWVLLSIGGRQQHPSRRHFSSGYFVLVEGQSVTYKQPTSSPCGARFDLTNDSASPDLVLEAI